MPTPLYFSVPTSGGGATAAATIGFFTIGYQPPRQTRSSSRDIVHNQNGVFKYVYDNGPGVFEWNQFEIEINDKFSAQLGTATTQYNNLQFLWNYLGGPIGMAAPEGVYSVGFTGAPLERQFKVYPSAAGDKAAEARYVINIEEQ